MKIYIAAKFSSRHRLQPIKFRLKQLGFDVLSDWIDYNPLDDTLGGDYDSIGNHPAASHDIAERDRLQVLECNVFVIDTLDASASGGREVELGMALMARKSIHRVGPIRNVFHAHKTIKAYDSWKQMLAELELYEAK